MVRREMINYLSHNLPSYVKIEQMKVMLEPFSRERVEVRDEMVDETDDEMRW